MKKLILLLIFAYGASLGCPTCVGHLELDSPPFFSDELYQTGQNPVEIDLDALLNT